MWLAVFRGFGCFGRCFLGKVVSLVEGCGFVRRDVLWLGIELRCWGCSWVFFRIFFIRSFFF